MFVFITKDALKGWAILFWVAVFGHKPINISA